MKRSPPKNILCIFGTRPEAIKMVPVVLALRAAPREFRVRVAVTAQHRELLDDVLRLFALRPDHDLNVMRSGQTLTGLSVRVLARLDPLLAAEKPDLVLVHGDTTTTLLGALAAFHRQIPVGHVEAGLRSGDPANPYPEEINRRLTDGVATLHFAPTAEARRNLLREGVSPRSVFVTGNTGLDALRMARARGAASAAPGRPFVLLTAHRRENFGRPLEDIFQAVRDVAQAHPAIDILYPVHPNPNVQGPARRFLGGRSNVRLMKPLSYGALVGLMSRALFVVTDSGGLQEEAPSLGKPVLVLRRVTERPEAVRAGTVRLAGTDRSTVRRWMERLLREPRLRAAMARAVNPYGDGRAAERTVRALRHHFYGGRRPADFVP